VCSSDLSVPMNRSWIVAVTAGCVIALAACSNDRSRSSNAQNTQNPNAQTGSRESDNNPTVTLTGCLVQGSSAGSFVLQNVRANKDKDAKDAQQATGMVPASYIVVASSDKVDLSKQLNHEVEIKGRPDTSGSLSGTTSSGGTSGGTTSGTSGSTGGSTSSGAASSSGTSSSATGTTSDQNLPRLMASNIKSVADRCTAPSH